jgi:hypothetical protein
LSLKNVSALLEVWHILLCIIIIASELEAAFSPLVSLLQAAIKKTAKSVTNAVDCFLLKGWFVALD